MTAVAIGPEGIGTVVLNGAGNGTVKLGPIGGREVWSPAVASVSASTGSPVVKEAQCRIYIGPAATPAYFVDGTLSGSTGDSTDRVSSATIRLPFFIWAVWTAGDAGAVATLNVNGTKDI